MFLVKRVNATLNPINPYLGQYNQFLLRIQPTISVGYDDIQYHWDTSQLIKDSNIKDPQVPLWQRRNESQKDFANGMQIIFVGFVWDFCV